ncbi:MAG: RloB family protein [Prolixibacteraceae bacterium]|jgi:hypothetical protein|uniref:RloB family protein n=1 Tax=Bacteroides sp. TaxID=29523 RepID=UPI002635E35B|nr:RloB family protein [Bacteroides sp.]MCK9414814.1 RloB family protein [Prolixibacteraceae bacterium]MDD3040459.1 RloB family protein [Bacteroides sp.]
MPKAKTYTKKSDQGKAWNRNKGSRYTVSKIEKKETVLIVCEGQTEKVYFESFPIRTLTVNVVDLGGQSKTKLVEKAKDLNKKHACDIVWCVFDMDVSRGSDEFQSFDSAILIAQQLKYEVAYSNDAFELWFYLHYHYTDQPSHRTFYYEKLSEFWDINYQEDGKCIGFCTQLYEILEKDSRASQAEAIKRAEKLHASYQMEAPHKQNPVTTVYKLVQYLNEHSF